MNCSTHPDVAAVAYCRSCGKALCADCRRESGGTVYCAEHAPAESASQSASYSSQPATTTPVHTNPGLAFVLGFIPGVGAIYNGQYGKGLMHAVIFGLMVSILSSNAARDLEPLIGIMLGTFVIYMAFEAHHTAKRRGLGEPVDEFSSLVHSSRTRSSGGAIALIIVGAVFLLNTLEIVDLRQILRFWPVLLILLGLNMLHSRVTEGGGPRGES
jgi:hypothetical protein